MALQSSLQIGNVIRNAVGFNVKNWMGGRMNSDSLIQSVQDLFAVLEQRKIDYVLVGGIALLHYVEGRNTQDLDLLMALSSPEKLPELKVSSQELYFVRAGYGELQINVLLTQNPLFKKVHGKYSKVQRFLDRNIPIATVEGLLLLKLYALPSLYQQGNFAKMGIYENDVATLLHYYQPDLSLLLEALSKYVNESDLAKIKALLPNFRIALFGSKTSRVKPGGWLTQHAPDTGGLRPHMRRFLPNPAPADTPNSLRPLRGCYARGQANRGETSAVSPLNPKRA